jgi:UPF0716 protein FxsA
MRFFLLVFIIVPVVEMFILIRVGSIIGALPTIALVVLTATVGVWLLKREGLATLARLQSKMANGEIPGKELLEGVMLIIGGALLLTPGFVTDAVGFVCLLPGLRQPLAVWLLKRTKLMQGGFQMGTGSAKGAFGFQSRTFNSRTFNHQSNDNSFDGRTFEGQMSEEEDVSNPDRVSPTKPDPSSDGHRPNIIEGKFRDLDPPKDSTP